MIPKSFLNRSILTLLILLIALIIYFLINIGNKFIPKDKRIELKDKKILIIVIGLLFTFVFYYLLKKYPILTDTFYTIILSAILAYLFNPIINFFERNNIKRLYGVLILYLLILAVIFILAFLVIPRSSKEIKKLAIYMPRYLKTMSEIIDNIYNKYYTTIGELPPIFEGVQQVIMENIVGIENIVVNALKSFVTGIINTFAKFISLVLTPILTLYFLADKDYFLKRIKKLIPNKYKDKSLELFRKIDESLSKFVRGKIILAISVGVGTTIALLIIGVDFAIFIGIITALADVIPYIGPFLGFLPAVFFAFLSSPIKAIWVSILFVLIQWIENNILAPKIIGDTTGIHPIMILLSIIIGGGVFGVVGMILAVPVVAVSTILFDFLSDEFKNTNIS